jgi:hypothetical protein
MLQVGLRAKPHPGAGVAVANPAYEFNAAKRSGVPTSVQAPP